MKSLTIFTLAVCYSFASFSQQSTKISMLSTALNEDRYPDIQKSPYLFDEYTPALVYDKKKNVTDEYLLNYNGYTKEFEFLYKGKTYVLDIRHYDEIVIEKYTKSADYSSKYVSESIKFVKGLDPNDQKNFQILVHADDHLSVYKKFEVKLALSESTGNGKGLVKTEFFLNGFFYYMLKDNTVSKLKLNKKNVQANLNDPEVVSYVKKNKLKLNSEQNLKQLLAYYTEVILVEKSASDPVARIKK